LRQAAATLFCLLAVVPLLVFVWTLHRLGVLGEPEAQIGVALSLTIAVLGFAVLLRLMGDISAVMRLLSATSARAKPADATPPVRSPVAPSDMPSPLAASPAAVRPTNGADGRRRASTPALGTIRELADMTAAISVLWREEAERQVGRTVRVDVINATVPVSGMLVEVTDDGLLLERDGERVGVVWRRVVAVEPDR
jgi:hypothetical protein